MPHINPTMPALGDPRGSEEIDLANAVQSILNLINGGLDADNLIAALNLGSGHLSTALKQEIGIGASSRGKSIVATEQQVMNVAYTSPGTPDEVADIVLPADGLLRVTFHAIAKNVAMNGGSAAIFLNGVQAKNYLFGSPPTEQNQSIPIDGTQWGVLRTSAPGLAFSGSGGTGDVPAPTSGHIVGGSLEIFADAGTYDVSVRYKHSVGGQAIAVKNRKLWVEARAF